MTTPHSDSGEPCPRCEERRALKEKGDPPEWFAKGVFALIAFIIVVITLVIVL